MKYKDINKQNREKQRRLLQRVGWQAVWALKKNGSWTWRWIHPTRKKAYTRIEAVKLTNLGRVV